MKYVGGRGKKAPYETTHIRVPIPLKSKIEAIVNEFKSGIETEDTNQLTTLENALDIAQNILKQKRSARASMEKLISALYQTEIKLWIQND